MVVFLVMVPEMVFPVKTLSDFGMSLSSLTSIVQEVMLKNKVRDAIARNLFFILLFLLSYE
jgi:hypothetical protein